MFGANVGFFELVPSGFESSVDKDASALGLHAVSLFDEVVFLVSDFGEFDDVVWFGVDGEDGDFVLAAEEFDGFGGAVVGELHFGDWFASIVDGGGHGAGAVDDDGEGNREFAVFVFELHGDGEEVVDG